ncbi:ADP-ribosylation factor [Ordospora pajunii]|jgi:ADP-ribosylation factor-like protein 1|uniref:ADP-ribosylation factor n=1 Tax=Ordospora pajunii TaxID=3039483 RepID=UPI0029527E9F|nr:ADP-ribosylation factor [Ordospora pajunii]KAH9410854.1 ADP-ribosylation factor [Ordospora pajunii]
MGNALSKINSVLHDRLRSLFSGDKEQSLAMIGLDGAGKTTLLFYLQTGEVHTTVPTLGFNCEVVNVGSLKFVVWDIGGQSTFRRFWKDYVKDKSGIVYMVDAVDTMRFTSAKEGLWEILKGLERSSMPPVLVFANKIDLIKTEEGRKMAVSSIYNALELKEYSGASCVVPISVYEANSVANEDNRRRIVEAFEWLNKELKHVEADAY